MCCEAVIYKEQKSAVFPSKKVKAEGAEQFAFQTPPTGHKLKARAHAC